jgi:hypothetical protein
MFSLPWYWRIWPGLFFLLFRKRMDTVMDEDLSYIQERLKIGGRENPRCAPAVPERFDLLNDFVSAPRLEVRSLILRRAWSTTAGTRGGEVEWTRRRQLLHPWRRAA